MSPEPLMFDRIVLGAAVVLTCVLFTRQAADPVNVIKLVALLLCALALVASAGYQAVRHRVLLVPRGPLSWLGGALAMAVAVSAAVAPVTSIAVLGTYGRNSGLLAYGSALVVMLAALRVLRPPHTAGLLAAVVLSGAFTASYGLLQRVGLDAVPWNNPFNPIIAALGNPNFASGYLGIAASVAAGSALWSGWPLLLRVLSGTTAVLCLLAAVLSTSVQGPIAAAGGLAVVALARVLDLHGRARRLGLVALAAAATTGAAVLGAAAVAKAGPAGAVFTDIGSQARVHYWQAALEMFRDAPLVGVGLDHYGVFWRSSRSLESVELLGGPGYADAAHSVPLQMLAQGGAVLAVTYAAFVLGVGVLLLRGLLKVRGTDRMLLGAVGGGWTAYQVQSLVSIDQVPLIVLHFVLAGAVGAVSLASPTRELRLPGAVAPLPVHKNDARAKRRVATPAVRHRPLDGVDVALIAIGALAVAVAAWASLVPLRANVAMAEGDRLLYQGDGTGALDEYDQAIGLVDGQAVHWLRRGALLLQVDQPAQARQAYEEAVERDPYDANALSLAAELAEKQGDLDRARDLHRRLLAVDPLNAERIVAACTFELRHSGAQTALDRLERALQRLPGEAALWATLGDARLVLQDPAGAREAYERALALDPTQETAQKGLDGLPDV